MSWFSRRKRRTAETDEATPAGPIIPDHPGPYDISELPDLGARADLGALRVPVRPGMRLRLDMERTSRNIVAATLAGNGSSLQLQVFAAPRSAGLWDELREEIAESITTQRGTSEDVEGEFGHELLTRIPVRTPQGGVGHRPARFIGVDGPRWFLRAMLAGRAAVDEAAAAPYLDILRGVVVVRGPEAHAPREVLVLRHPGDAADEEVETTATDGTAVRP